MIEVVVEILFTENPPVSHEILMTCCTNTEEFFGPKVNGFSLPFSSCNTRWPSVIGAVINDDDIFRWDFGGHNDALFLLVTCVYCSNKIVITEGLLWFGYALERMTKINSSTFWWGRRRPDATVDVVDQPLPERTAVVRHVMQIYHVTGSQAQRIVPVLRNWILCENHLAVTAK